MSHPTVPPSVAPSLARTLPIAHLDAVPREDAEATLAPVQSNYRGLLEAAPDAMIVVNQHGGIVLLNLQADRQFGYQRNELLGQHIATIIPEGFAERLVADSSRTAAEALEQQIGMGLDLVGRRMDGGTFPIELMLSPLHSNDGPLVIAAIRDISLRKAAEQTLVRMEARYRGLLEAAPDAMIVVDQAGRIVLLNLQAERHFGYQRDELVGQPVTNLVPQGFADRLIADRLRSPQEAQAQQMGTGIELTGRRKDGTSFPIEIMLSPLDSDDGMLVTAAIRDMTVRRALDAQLRQSQKMEAIGNLAGGMAHDFNNMLTVIIGNLDSLMPLLPPDSEPRMLANQTLEAALRGAELTGRLLAFARRQPLSPRRVQANEVIRNIVKLLERMLGAQVAITLDLAEDAWPVVIDAALFAAVIANLATNARDAMPSGGSLTIATANHHLGAQAAAQPGALAAGDYLAITVADTGEGMTPEVMARIFEPFFTTKALDRGTGLGLSMAFGFMEQSGGQITVQSAPGVGSVFRLVLPRLRDAAEPAPPPPRPARPVPAERQAVLVVEDNPALRRLVVRQLAELGYRVLEADSALHALAMLQSETVDLLFSDVVMPGPLDGFALARQTAVLHPGVKILLTSGFPANMASESVATRLLGKPYRRDELAGAIRAALQS